MKIIMVISPDYLSAVYEESKKYSFMIQGYGSFAEACKRLLRVNSGNLLGIAYLGENLPQAGSKEYKAMCEFMKYCDLLEDSKKMVFVIQGAEQGLSQATKELKQLRVFVTSGEPVITDSVINKQIFGSILLDTREAYKLQEDNSSTRDNNDDFLLQYTPMIGQMYLQCFSPIEVLSTAQETLENDQVYKSCKDNENSLLALLRKRCIQKKFDISDTRLDEVIKSSIAELNDDVAWCLCNLLKESELNEL